MLIPAAALPLAGLGHDAALMILVAVMGTGFCQSMMASAKPVAIFAGAEAEDNSFTQADLFRLALPLAPMVTALLIAFALLVWPQQLAQMRGMPAPQITQIMVPQAQPGPSVAIPAPPALSAARPPKRPIAEAVVARKPRSKALPPKGLRQLQAEVNRALRPAGIRIKIR